MQNARTPAIIALLFFLVALPGYSSGQGTRPSWFDRTIIPEENFIYAVGHSGPRDNEQDARDEALANATREFVRYCRVDVDSFDRSVEVYATERGKNVRSQDVRSQNLTRAKAFVSRGVPEEWYVNTEKNRYLASVLFKVPREEFDRIAKENNIKLSLDVLLYREGEKGRMETISEGNVLASGEGYAVYVRPSDTCYLYVYQIDGLGKSFRLFPSDRYKTAKNPVAAGEGLWIPNDGDLFVLDMTTGKEYLYLFASPQPVPEFEKDGGSDLAKTDIDNLVALKKMGVAGLRPKVNVFAVTPPKHAALDVIDVKHKLQSEGALVYETWFWHR